MRKSLKQIVYNKIGDIAKESHFPDLFQPTQVRTAVESNGRISFPQERDSNIIMARQGYKRYPILTDNATKSSIDDLLTYQNMHLVDQLLISSNRFFTHGTTGFYTPFALTNFIRHQIDAVAQSQNGYTPLITPLQTLMKAIAQRNSIQARWAQEYMALGGMRQTLVGWQDQSPEELMHTITHEKNGLIKAIDFLDKGMNILAIPSKYSELLTRMGEYIRSRQNGNPQLVALEDAGRVDAPFHHIGTWGGNRGKMFVKSTSFFNADLQYMDMALRSLGNPKTRSRYLWTTILITASIIAAGRYLAQFGSPEQKQIYTDLQPNDLARYLWLPSPDGKTLIKFPMPQQMTITATLINMLMAQTMDHANYSGLDFLQGAGAILPNPLNVTDFGHFLTTYVPQIIKPAFEVAANIKDYPKLMPLVPQSLQGLPPSQQYNKGTSVLAKTLGGLLNLSPLKIDYLITGYFGRAAGYLTIKGTNFNPASGVTQGDYFDSGRTVQNFYNAKQANDQNWSAMRKGTENFTPQQRQTIVRDHNLDVNISHQLTNFRKIDVQKQPQQAAQLRSRILQLINTRNNVK